MSGGKIGVPPSDLFLNMKVTVNSRGSSWSRYAQSKLANILHAKALAEKYPAIFSVSIHPGTIKTTIFDKMNSSTISLLVKLAVWAMFSSIEDGGKFNYGQQHQMELNRAFIIHR